MYRLCRWSLVLALISMISMPLLAQVAPPSDQADVTVVVTAERTLQPVSESIASATVVTAKQIRDEGAQSVVDVLRLVPGAVVTQNGQTGSLANAHLRGTSTSQVLVLVDGQRLSSSAFGGTADLSKIPVSDVARVEVIRGPVSSLYGSDAIGGVINIITKKPTGSRGEVKLGYGDNQRQSRYMMVGGGDQNTAWQLTTDFPVYSGTVANSDYSGTDIAGRVDLNNLKGWELSLRGDGYHDTLGLPGSVGFPSPNDHQWWDRGSFDISAKRAMGAGQLELHAYTIDQKLKELNPDYFTNTLITGTTRATEATYRLTRGNQSWVFGGELRGEDYTDVEGGLVQADKGITNRALFAQDRIVLNKTTDALVGARLDDHSVAGNKVTPRLGINRAISDKTHMRASYSAGFRAPSLVDLYYNNFGTVGNPNLKPEQSHQYELGVNAQLGADTLDVALFTNSVTDQITWQSAATVENPWAGTFMNVDRARQRGMELSWDHPLKGSMHLNMFYTYIDARNLTNGTRLSGIPYNQIGATLSSKVKTWSMALTGRCTSDRHYGVSKVDGKPVLDFTVTRQTDKPTNPYLIIRNLTNAAYEEVAGYRAEGRSFEVGMRTSW